jgi:hypothetical protein
LLNGYRPRKGNIAVFLTDGTTASHLPNHPPAGTLFPATLDVKPVAVDVKAFKDACTAKESGQPLVVHVHVKGVPGRQFPPTMAHTKGFQSSDLDAITL